MDPVSNPSRLAALRATELLDGIPEEAFDRLTRLASVVVGAPVSLVSLVDLNRQVFKSHVGLAEPWASRRETPLTHSFCQHVVRSGRPLVVSNARTDGLVKDNLAIDDLGVVAYAGFPIADDDGHWLGSLCAIDTKARVWTDEELAALHDVAALVESEITLRAAVRRERESREALEAVNAALADRNSELAERNDELERARGELLTLNTALDAVEADLRQPDESSDPIALLRDVAAAVAPLNEDVSITVVEPEGALPPLRTDLGKLSELLRSVVVGALRRATFGTIRLEARSEQAGDRIEFVVGEPGAEPVAGASAFAHGLAGLLGGEVVPVENATIVSVPAALPD